MPDCLRESMLKITICDENITGLLDTGSSHSYIDEETAKKLDLKISPTKSSVTLASASSQATITGFCNADLYVEG